MSRQLLYVFGYFLLLLIVCILYDRPCDIYEAVKMHVADRLAS